MELSTVMVKPLDSKKYEGTVTIPAEVDYEGRKFRITEYRTHLFEGCTKLEKVYLPKGVPASPYMFSECTSLDWQMVFDQMEGTIPDGLFQGCAKITDLVVPSRFYVLGSNIFGSDLLNSITIESGSIRLSLSSPESLKCKRLILDRDLQRQFEESPYLEEIEVGSNVTTLQSGIFSGMNKLKKVVFKGKDMILPDYCFSGCESLTSVELPENVPYISEHCFENCKSLTTFDFPETVTTVGEYAFCNSGLEKLVILASLQTIDVYAFKDCKSLKEIHLQTSDDLLELKTLKEVDTPNTYYFSPFNGSDNVVKIYVDRPVNWALTQDCWVWSNILNHDPNIILTYTYDTICPNLQEVVFGPTIEEVPDGFLTGCENLVKIKLGENVKIIGAQAFRKCKALNKIEIPASVTLIGERAFAESSLRQVKGMDNIVEVGNEAFANSKIEEIYFPESAERIGANAFAKTPLKSVSGMVNVKEFGEGAFKQTKIQEFYCPEKVRELPDRIFSVCQDLKLVFLHGDLESIAGYAFEGNTSLEKIYCRCIIPPVFGPRENGEQYFSNKKYFDVNVYVPEESLDAYLAAPVWRSFLNLQAFDFTAVDDIVADDSEIDLANAIVYDLSCKRMRVTDLGQLPYGFYIISDGVKARKVMVK